MITALQAEKLRAANALKLAAEQLESLRGSAALDAPTLMLIEQRLQELHGIFSNIIQNCKAGN
jgi:hypothetical protein